MNAVSRVGTLETLCDSSSGWPAGPPFASRQGRLGVASASMTHRTPEELDAGLEHVRGSPSDRGELRLIVRRPGVDERELIDEGVLDPGSGLVGDNWASRGSSRTEDGRANIGAQVTIMNSRVLDVIAGPVEFWPQAGDQLYADLDLSHDNLPAGTRLAVGAAQLEVTGVPHTGCGKFVQRFGLAAMRWVNSEAGMQLRLRGVNTSVVKAGAIRVGDRVSKADGASGYADWSGGEP